MMYQAPRGTQDLLPDDAHLWRHVEQEARRQAALANYGEIRTPTFEATAVFARGVGAATDIVEKEMYTFLDKSGDSMTLRPEATAAFMRAYFEHGMASRPQPVKLYTLLQAFRYDKPQKGRLREFHQFNVEAIGETDPALDAELVSLQWRFFASLGLRELTLHINSIGDPICRPSYLQALRKYFQAHEQELCADCQRRLATNPLRLLDDKTPSCQPILDAAPASADHLCQACSDHFEAWQRYLRAVGIAFTVDHRLVRGLDYYTRSVWEVFPPSIGAQSTIGGGGRYDGLAEQLGGRPTPAVGFACGIERIVLNLKEQGVEIPERCALEVYLVAQHETKAEALRLAESLRTAGIKVDIAFGDRKMNKQLAAADKAGARFAVIVGQEEVARGEVALKDLRDGSQRAVPTEQLANAVREATA